MSNRRGSMCAFQSARSTATAEGIGAAPEDAAELVVAVISLCRVGHSAQIPCRCRAMTCQPAPMVHVFHHPGKATWPPGPSAAYSVPPPGGSSDEPGPPCVAKAPRPQPSSAARQSSTPRPSSCSSFRQATMRDLHPPSRQPEFRVIRPGCDPSSRWALAVKWPQHCIERSRSRLGLAAAGKRRR